MSKLDKYYCNKVLPNGYKCTLGRNHKSPCEWPYYGQMLVGNAITFKADLDMAIAHLNRAVGSLNVEDSNNLKAVEYTAEAISLLGKVLAVLGWAEPKTP